MLMLISLSFAVSTRLEQNITVACVDGAKAQYLAEAGLNNAISQLRADAKLKFDYTDANISINGVEQFLDGVSSYTIVIEDEQRKVNLNDANRIISITYPGNKTFTYTYDDVGGHYELGFFCMENSLLDYALKEFNQAKNINPEYEDAVIKHIEYIASVKKKTEEMMNKVIKEEDMPLLTLIRVTQDFKKGDLPIPYSYKDAEVIVKVINSLKNNESKQEYARRYIELGSYLEKAPIRRPQVKNNEKSDIALFCYEIAYKTAHNARGLTL